MSDTPIASPGRFCMACGTPVPPAGRFCLKCGRPQTLPETAAPAVAPPPVPQPAAQPAMAPPVSSTPVPLPPVPGAPAASPGRFCMACGTPVSPASRFCLKCGQPQTAPEAAAPTEDPPPEEPPQPAAPGAPAASPGSLCVACGTPVSPASRFCLKCGKPQTAPETAAPTVAPPPLPQPAPQPAATGYQVTLTNAGPYKGRVIIALRQLLQIDAPAAGRFVAAAPAVLAVGLSQEMAERLRATLVGAGAVVQVAGPPEPAEIVRQVTAPKPEPKRSMAETALVIAERPPRRGPRTLTGLALGRGGSYLAYGRAEGSRLLAPPDLIRLDSRSMIPTAVRLSGHGGTELCGNRALASWVQDPAAVSLGFTEELGLDDGASLPATRAFLKFLNYRLVEVLGPGAASAAEGAATTVALSCGRAEPLARQLAEVAGQAGFPVVQVVPEPLAAVASYLTRDSAGPQHFLVIDWGSQGLDLAVVEDSTVIDHVEYPLGGIWFDMILEGWLAERLPGGLSDEDRRSLTLFARQFKENASTAFAEGRAEHVQYCVLPV